MIEVPEQESRIEGPYADDKSMFMEALGALLASTMRSEFDFDDCESR